MNFFVEDGTGKDNATSYVSLDFTNTYFSNLFMPDWEVISDITKKICCNKATFYIDARFGSSFLLKKTYATQALEYPRGRASFLPNNLRKATCEYGIRTLDSLLNSTIELCPDINDDNILSKSESVGPIQEQTSYRNIDKRRFKSYSIPDMLMLPFLGNSKTIRN